MRGAPQSGMQHRLDGRRNGHTGLVLCRSGLAVRLQFSADGESGAGQFFLPLDFLCESCSQFDSLPLTIFDCANPARSLPRCGARRRFSTSTPSPLPCSCALGQRIAASLLRTAASGSRRFAFTKRNGAAQLLLRVLVEWRPTATKVDHGCSGTRTNPTRSRVSSASSTCGPKCSPSSIATRVLRAPDSIPGHPIYYVTNTTLQLLGTCTRASS